MDDPHLSALAGVPDAHLLAGMPCDHCKRPAVRWFKGTGVRLCELQACFDFFAAERRRPEHKTRAA